MTLSSFLNNDHTAIHSLMNERGGEHISYSPQWKGGGQKGNTQSALSALTLLAFLFFLNMLQNCLRDQMLNQAPITIMMTTTTTTTAEAQRLKREADKINYKGDPATFKKKPNPIKFSNFLTKNYEIFFTKDRPDPDNLSQKEKTESSFDNSADKISAWIYDTVCCKDCESKNAKSRKETFENYLRKSVIMFCGLFDADSMKNCQNESEYCSNQGYKDET